MEQRLGSSSEDVLPTPIPGGRALSTQERQSIDLSSRIKGWGSDLDPHVRPGVPRDKAPELGVEVLYPPIEQQMPKVKIHKSTEHGRLTPVFGTSCPPTGVSGFIRDIAYTYSEGRLAHWMTLMFADRVNVVEDLVKDITQLRVPNIPKEMGFKSELKYNPAGLSRKIAIAGLCVAAFVAYTRSRDARRNGDGPVGVTRGRERLDRMEAGGERELRRVEGPA
jgi:hypothetical protein